MSDGEQQSQIKTRGKLLITPNFTSEEYLEFIRKLFKASHPWNCDPHEIFLRPGFSEDINYVLHDLKYYCEAIKAKGKSVNGTIYFSASWRDKQLIDFMSWDVVDNEVYVSHPEYNDCNVMEVFCVNYEKELERLRQENKLLKLHIKYMPEGPGAEKAKEHWKSLQD